MEIKVNTFEDEVTDENNNTTSSPDFDEKTKSTKKLVTLECRHTNGSAFAISKRLTISNSKSDDDYVKEAYEAMKDNATAWSNEYKLVGKTFNPDTGKME